MNRQLFWTPVTFALVAVAILFFALAIGTMYLADLIVVGAKFANRCARKFCLALYNIEV